MVRGVDEGGMTMREKMARAMYETVCRRLEATMTPASLDALKLIGWDEENPELRAGWLANVDAALEALAQPTALMVDHALDGEILETQAREAWSAMIDAAKAGA